MGLNRISYCSTLRSLISNSVTTHASSPQRLVPIRPTRKSLLTISLLCRLSCMSPIYENYTDVKAVSSSAAKDIIILPRPHVAIEAATVEKRLEVTSAVFFPHGYKYIFTRRFHMTKGKYQCLAGSMMLSVAPYCR